ncbi:AAA-domain-containing protein [Teratosphaeria nubilosa]|uniref:Peroxisomal ATPase PEX1 n=1 Tax=Teratosphaeria nubilosa TaxID=161662 RepID=A0A6G1L5B8_9PEZI|nr:AAA-domain-containing protein [Teratosphaeria nubilosa]
MSTPRRASTPGTGLHADVALVPSLKNCLVNLPASVVQLLLNANTVAQNVVVELGWRQQPDPKPKPPGQPRSVYLGWTGMQSQSRFLAPLVGRDGRSGGGGGGGGGGGEGKEVPVVEVDATFGRLIGLAEGLKVSVSLHLDPPQAHTVNIEPLTATDWEIIELHAHFLEMNFLSQVRALPNPSSGAVGHNNNHPLTLHLTPTSTANIRVTTLTPPQAAAQAFVKIAADAEVVVAPKVRSSQGRVGGGGRESVRDSRSVTSRRSEGGRSARSAAARARGYEEERARPPVFLRAVCRALQGEWFVEGAEEMKDEGLRAWVDRECLLSKTLRGVTWVVVSVVKPAGLQEPVDPSQAQQGGEAAAASRVVAKLGIWDDAPDARHAALSSDLCGVLGVDGMVGGIVKIDPAPTPLPKTASALKEPSQQASKEAIVRKLRATPYLATSGTKEAQGFKFGGESKGEQSEAVQRLKTLFGRSILEGPVTNGMFLPPQGSWPGGVVDFEPTPPGDPSKAKVQWLVGGERKLDLSVQPGVAPPKVSQAPGRALCEARPSMVGIEALIEQTRRSLLNSSSVLLTGGLGAGKSSLAQLIAHQLRDEYLFHMVYFPCRALVTEEMRVKSVKELLYRVFASAQWGARFGGRALVVLDDLDRLCPVETELQVDANGRSRQVSELLIGIVRQFCGRDSGVVLLATAQGKEAVNNVVTGGHVVRDILALKAPGKEGRRKIVEMLVSEGGRDAEGSADGNPWMEGSDESRPASAAAAHEGVGVDPELDLLDIAGQTDGYMPGDLALLVSRARSEALVRALSDTSGPSDSILLTASDFSAALKNFTPASLRGVTLQSSTTTFANIGGLKETRQTLLETLQYPTTYAPLFAKCPLRLRSGLLLYGYPGCGKTLLASAVAGECGLNFISVKGPEILNKYIGASEKSVRDLFERAEAARPCVLFFDEFDSIAPKRGHDSTGVTDRVVNMLLTMMDGAEGLQGVYVLAATSRPDLIDPALLRPGRLDRSLLCDLPGVEEREDILRAVGRGLRFEEGGVEEEGWLGAVAARTEGCSGADLQAVLYNAHLEAIQDVLGYGSEAAAAGGRQGKVGAAAPRKGGKAAQEFTYSRFGGDPEAHSSSPLMTPAQLAAERAGIAAKLSALHLARKKAKAERHASSSSFGPQPNGVGSTGDDDASAHEPVIGWRHLERSLRGTRASISAGERARLQAVYREFVRGRNGEMSDGSGGTEVGGRATLM